MNNLKNIQVLGSGCPACQKLYKLTQQVVKDLGLSVTVEYIKDLQRILDFGLMQSPVLVVNGQAVLVGFTSDIKKIKKLIQDNF
ncbi:thioredoxin family protein [Patescibacteria group bacterium]|nr:thioredoxin family protein [Patescibacteria group bacterium]